MNRTHKTSDGRTRGFTLIEIMIVVAIIGMLAGIATASFVKARTQAQTNICINNLIKIDQAKEQFALEYSLATGAAVVDASVNAYIKGDHTPVCPGNGAYTYHALGTDPTCSVSVHVLANNSTNSPAAPSSGPTPRRAPRASPRSSPRSP